MRGRNGKEGRATGGLTESRVPAVPDYRVVTFLKRTPFQQMRIFDRRFLFSTFLGLSKFVFETEKKQNRREMDHFFSPFSTTLNIFFISYHESNLKKI